ncbi:MAG: Peptidase M24 [Candidatus Nomurabacteria bacterium GW2011_GWA1_37_20]|uniref:Peptidase M24 n=2 Tax=Parcubacteria group TaxID=1794811 RepID=A0A0G0HZD5_9BACT|nr:MAG: Peptidase M24 [Parcubacteria group bacterium GW2011_GWC1_36_9]KKQ26072.1 MAG: Peptidase M24 [Parcubacteria group bacterium GW2011_GWB1_37_13]KKQ30000.1 MAG: Peptidase M24 [Candidatus Nomurabacteria bacterium GW2011_GWA1_37_20]KKQ47662.1 MAG: Peptidase M24 [Candidatus Yanofskybacteria bacterium GW2011_GWC2_37_9]
MKTKLIHEVRAVKSKKELANIIKAQRISEKVLRYIVAKLRTGVSEIEIANLIKKSFVKYGAPILSFLPIVAFGKNTANIHHKPGSAKLKKDDIIMLDFGCTVNHYCSDMTRTYFLGKPSKKQKKIYENVLRAMDLAMNKIKRGERRAKMIDKTARNFLNKKFNAKKFPHGLGHGIGTVIHEWPNFKPKSEDVLPIGCVMTIEPGLYFKGFGGVRIEDMILITKKGYKNLTNFPKDLNSAIL